MAAFRAFIQASGDSPQERELVAAKTVGQWRSGAPLALAPERDDPQLAADPTAHNDFTYADDPQGLRAPRRPHPPD